MTLSLTITPEEAEQLKSLIEEFWVNQDCNGSTPELKLAAITWQNKLSYTTPMDLARKKSLLRDII